MENGECTITVGRGETSYEAVCNALWKTRLNKRMKDWVVVLSCKDFHGNYTTPSIMDRPTMGILRKEGLYVVIYVQKDGSLRYFTP